MAHDKPGRFSRFEVRFLGLAQLREPEKSWIRDPVKDSLMAFHYCRPTSEYRYDRYFDPLSRSAHFRCGGCGAIGLAGPGIGLLSYMLFEYKRVAREVGRNFVTQVLLFCRFTIFGLGKYLPEHRDGKTAGEMHIEAMSYILGAVETAIGAQLER